jgi:hypothetical protein
MRFSHGGNTKICGKLKSSGQGYPVGEGSRLVRGLYAFKGIFLSHNP